MRKVEVTEIYLNQRIDWLSRKKIPKVNLKPIYVRLAYLNGKQNDLYYGIERLKVTEVYLKQRLDYLNKMTYKVSYNSNKVSAKYYQKFAKTFMSQIKNLHIEQRQMSVYMKKKLAYLYQRYRSLHIQQNR
jgi:hypothetical protein